jgi:hypothetical protein
MNMSSPVAQNKEEVQEKIRDVLIEFDRIAYSYMHYSLPPGLHQIAEQYHKDDLAHQLRAVDVNALAPHHVPADKYRYDNQAPYTDASSLFLAASYGCEKILSGRIRCDSCAQCKESRRLEKAGIDIRKGIGKIVSREVVGCGERTGSYFSNGASRYTRWNTRFQYGAEHWQQLLELKAMPLKRLQAMRDWTLSWQDQDLVSGFAVTGQEFYTWQKEEVLNEQELALLGYRF